MYSNSEGFAGGCDRDHIHLTKCEPIFLNYISYSKPVPSPSNNKTKN